MIPKRHKFLMYRTTEYYCSVKPNVVNTIISKNKNKRKFVSPSQFCRQYWRKCNISSFSPGSTTTTTPNSLKQNLHRWRRRFLPTCPRYTGLQPACLSWPCWSQWEHLSTCKLGQFWSCCFDPSTVVCLQHNKRWLEHHLAICSCAVEEQGQHFCNQDTSSWNFHQGQHRRRHTHC